MPSRRNRPSEPTLFEAPAPARPEAREPGAAPAENHWDYCPNCGARLQNQGCKYRCPRCFYFMSCSDFD